MKKLSLALLTVAVAFAPAVAQVADTSPATPPPTLAELGMIIYPADGQTPEQQALDEEACTTWAETQTGIRMTAGTPDTQAAGEAAAAQATQATQGAAVGGAARGALGGLAIGAIAGDAGQGAAIGAAAGAMGGMRARRRAVRSAQAQGEQQAVQQNQEMIDRFTGAVGVCLSGRGYSVA